MNRSRTGIRGSQGQAMVELALLMPFIMMLVIGVLEIGRAWQHKQTLTDAAREGARLSAIDNGAVDQDSVISLVRTMVANAGFDSSSSSLTMAWPIGCRWTATCGSVTGRGEITAFQLTQPHQFVAIHKLVQMATSGTGQMTFRSTSRMRVE